MKIRKGDTVIVIAGNDRGQTGTVQEVMHNKGRVVVEGVNLRYRHRKPTQQNPQGELKGHLKALGYSADQVCKF